MMVLVVFLAGINVLYVLGAAVRAAFSGVVIDLYFLRTTVVVLFAKTDVLTHHPRNNYARVILVANLCVDAK